MSADAGERAGPEHLVVGQITKAHGTKGELFVWPLTDRPDEVFAAGRQLLIGDEEGLVDEEATLIAIESSRPFKRGLLIKFEELETREDADELAQRYLLLPAEAVPPLEEGEFFYHQLLGMSVETVSGAHVGRVREVYDTAPHHLLEIEGAAGERHLVPFAERIVRAVLLDRATIVIDPPEGLLDL